MWLSALKALCIPDWLIIVVTHEESKVKSKILRTSVYDRVKNEFNSKTTNRCDSPFRLLVTDVPMYLLIFSELFSYRTWLMRFPLEVEKGILPVIGAFCQQFSLTKIGSQVETYHKFLFQVLD